MVQANSPPPFRPALGPTRPPIKWVPGHSLGKRPGPGINHHSLSSAKVKEKVGLYIYYSSVPSWQVIRELYHFTFTVCSF